MRSDSFASPVSALALGVLLCLSACGPTYPTCSTDEHCASEGQVCVNKVCRECRDDAPCMKKGPCGVCLAHACGRMRGCCESDLDCPEGYCAQIRGQPHRRCWSDCGPRNGVMFRCPPDLVCEGGRCVRPKR